VTGVMGLGDKADIGLWMNPGTNARHTILFD